MDQLEKFVLLITASVIITLMAFVIVHLWYQNTGMQLELAMQKAYMGGFADAINRETRNASYDAKPVIEAMQTHPRRVRN